MRPGSRRSGVVSLRSFRRQALTIDLAGARVIVETADSLRDRRVVGGGNGEAMRVA
jgi:hypothetical protein